MQCCAHPYYDELRDPSTVFIVTVTGMVRGRGSKLLLLLLVLTSSHITIKSIPMQSPVLFVC